MRSSWKKFILISLLFLGLVLCAACTQKDGPAPFAPVGQTPGIAVSPGQPGSAATMGTCLPPQVWCNNRCVDISAERENCGACGALCPEGKICRNTQCVAGNAENPGNPGNPVGTENPGTPPIPGTPGITGTTPAVTGTPVIAGTTGTPSCSSGQTNCYGTCTDLQSDATHCGACNTKCPSGKVCSAGSCTISCSAGLDNCGGSCTNTQTSSQHCGKCSNPCPSGQTCQKGKCGLYASVMTLDPQQLCTSSGKLWCSGTCIAQGLANCGSCGKTCKVGEYCPAGKCLSWTGTWTGSWIDVEYSGSPVSEDDFSLVQTGTSVIGTIKSAKYSGYKYQFEGDTVGNPPGVISGYWDGPLWDDGDFQFTMSADGKQFTGWMEYSGKNNSLTFSRK